MRWCCGLRTSDPAEVAGLASTRTFPLRSSFAPSYNMTINLVNQMGPDAGAQAAGTVFRAVPGGPLGGRSGARHRARRADARRDRRRTRWRRRARSSITRGCARQIAEREKAQSRASRLQRRKAVNDALSALRRGDIVNIANGRRAGLAVVLEPARDSDDPRPLVLTENRWAGRISSADYSGASAKVGTMTLPKRVEHRQPRVRRDVASALRSADGGDDDPQGQAKWPTTRA